MPIAGRVALLLLSVALVACGDKASPPASAASPAATPSAPTGAPADAALAAGLSQQVREISEDELVRYMATIQDVRELGPPAKAKLGKDPSQLEGLFAGMQNLAQFDETLGKHDFLREAFLQVHHSAIRTYAALMIDEQQVELDQAKAEQDAAFEKMKGTLSAEQIESMKKMAGMADQTLAAYRDVPAANKELLARHRAEFETAIGK